MSSSPSLPELSRELRWIADSYDQAQNARIRTGERIRALLQGRGEGAPPPPPDSAPPDTVLASIRRGGTEGPAPLLGRAYRRQYEQEQEMAKLLEDRLALHPAWPWLRRVKGIGPTLAGKLVSRLDVTRAETPSSFWAYCGLATVPGVEYRCEACGMSGAFPESYRVSGQHTALGGTGTCAGQMKPMGGADRGVRVAQPKPGRGEKSAYDRHAKKTCYLIGTSFLRSGGEFELFYRRERRKLDGTRPGWAEGRKHLTALRKTEKLFLAQLWIVWRQALELPITRPYAQAQEEQEGWIDPWDMAAPERPRRWVAGQPDPPRRAPA